MFSFLRFDGSSCLPLLARLLIIVCSLAHDDGGSLPSAACWLNVESDFLDKYYGYSRTAAAGKQMDRANNDESSQPNAEPSCFFVLSCCCLHLLYFCSILAQERIAATFRF